jgi:hypothetical protein
VAAIEYGNKKGEDDIAKLGIEFWSTLLEGLTEIEKELMSIVEGDNKSVTSSLHQVTELAAPALFPVLFNILLTKVCHFSEFADFFF